MVNHQENPTTFGLLELLFQKSVSSLDQAQQES